MNIDLSRNTLGKIGEAIAGAQPLERQDIKGHSQLCPETLIVFTTFGRPEIAEQSFRSLLKALSAVRSRVRVVVCDGSPTPEKAINFRQHGADDVIWVPTFLSAASQRNLCVALALDKYSANYICLLEDDYEYTDKWYPAMVEATKRVFGVISPFGIPYGMVSATRHSLEKVRVMEDSENRVTAYIFGAIADQRFMPLSHYLSVLRFWDPDVLGLSYCQTGMQTGRNLMRGYCGAILPGDLCAEIPGQQSTWRGQKRYVGPAAHDLDPSKFAGIVHAVVKQGVQ